jgi:hypothetical protein
MTGTERSNTIAHTAAIQGRNMITLTIALPLAISRLFGYT